VRLAEGARIVCVDNLQTGNSANLVHLERDSSFTITQVNLIEPLLERYLPKYFD
jgi:UDP-glucuronate decarboxylase